MGFAENYWKIEGLPGKLTYMQQFDLSWASSVSVFSVEEKLMRGGFEEQTIHSLPKINWRSEVFDASCVVIAKQLWLMMSSTLYEPK